VEGHADGSLRMSARVDDAEAERQIRNGTLRGLSLDEGQNVLFRPTFSGENRHNK
jgi:hypothetical protein